MFGRNAAKPYGLKPEDIAAQTAGDAVARDRLAYAERPNPSFATYGPRTRREFANLMRASGGQP